MRIERDGAASKVSAAVVVLLAGLAGSPAVEVAAAPILRNQVDAMTRTALERAGEGRSAACRTPSASRSSRTSGTPRAGLCGRSWRLRARPGPATSRAASSSPTAPGPGLQSSENLAVTNRAAPSSSSAPGSSGSGSSATPPGSRQPSSTRSCTPWASARTRPRASRSTSGSPAAAAAGRLTSALGSRASIAQSGRFNRASRTWKRGSERRLSNWGPS